MGKLLITGGTGFIGSRLLSQLQHSDIITAGRAAPNSNWPHYPINLSGQADYSNCLTGVSTIIHLAGQSQAAPQASIQQRQQLKNINIDATLALAKQAQAKGVQRFIFISSAKVNGEANPPGHPFSADNPPQPHGLYAQSKLKAERGLIALSRDSDMELVILRPTMVYGPQLKGNFASLVKLAKSPLYLPLGQIDNRRSMVYIDNLISAISHCVNSPKAAGKIFMVADQDPVSTSELLIELRQGLNKPTRLWPAPKGLIKMILKLAGRLTSYHSLFSDFEVDSQTIQSQLDWQPPFSRQQGLQHTLLSLL